MAVHSCDCGCSQGSHIAHFDPGGYSDFDPEQSIIEEPASPLYLPELRFDFSRLREWTPALQQLEGQRFMGLVTNCYPTFGDLGEPSVEELGDEALIDGERGDEFCNDCDEDLTGGNAKFIPKCGKAYTVNISYSVLVDDCDNITAAEEREMEDGLEAEAERAARKICVRNKACPNVTNLKFKQETSNSCERRLWNVNQKWTFTCTK